MAALMRTIATVNVSALEGLWEYALMFDTDLHASVKTNYLRTIQKIANRQHRSQNIFQRAATSQFLDADFQIEHRLRNFLHANVHHPPTYYTGQKLSFLQNCPTLATARFIYNIYKRSLLFTVWKKVTVSDKNVSYLLLKFNGSQVFLIQDRLPWSYALYSNSAGLVTLKSNALQLLVTLPKK